ncbi:short-chain dehydrogenase, partial [Methylobacterium radiotolerans]
MSSRNGRSTVMVTGASAGVGRACRPTSSARHGWNVGL